MIDINSTIFSYPDTGKISPDSDAEMPIIQNQYFELNVIQHGIVIPYLMKKCCKKYKKGKRCKNCPNE